MTLVDFSPHIVNSFYAVFVTVSVSMNGLIIYLVKQRSPQIVRNLKAMIINTSIIQILIALLAGFLQGRILATTSGTAFLPVGPCRLFGPMTCFVTFNVIMALAMHAELLIVHTMFFRYRMLQCTEMSTGNVVLSYVIMAILPIILLILPHTGSLRFDVVMKQAIREYPGHNLENYGEFGGSKPVTDPTEAARSLISSGIVAFSPIFMFYFKRRILKTLSSAQQRYTEKTVQSSKMFLKALTVQAMIPIICYAPVSVLFELTRILEPKIVFIEYLAHVFMVLPCVLDPLTTMYFVSPYRTWISKKICKGLKPVKKHRSEHADTATSFRH